MYKTVGELYLKFKEIESLESRINRLESFNNYEKFGNFEERTKHLEDLKIQLKALMNESV